MNASRYALILAGGSGTRLWPMSRSRRPKQLLPLIEGRTLLELSFDRLEGLVEPERRLVCGAAEHGRLVRRALGIRARAYIGEPVPRDTLAAVACCTALIARQDPEALIGVFTADHLIEPVSVFREVVESAFRFVEQRPGTLLTFGITPTAAATGFGYLELGESLGDPVRRVRRFHEKPAAEAARLYLEAGPERYLWNSGMFVWKAPAFLECVQRYEPQLRAGVGRIAAAGGRRAAMAAVYPGLKKISVDFGVMEPASLDPQVSVATVPMRLQWKDIGSWSAYAEVCLPDPAGNAAPGTRSVLLDSADNLVLSSDPQHLLAAVGCEGLAIVHTPDATLVCPKRRAQEVKALLERIRREHGERYD